MEYKGLDYTRKTPEQNLEMLFNSVCIELVKSNKMLLERAEQITQKHIEIMLEETKQTDKNRHFLHGLSSTWDAMKNIIK